jgi:uncharacterized protein (TIGR03790 family)
VTPRACLALLLAGSGCAWGQTGANVLLIVNETSPVSKRIGEEYVRKRGVPLAQVCRIRTTQDEAVGRDMYEKEIEARVARCLRAAPDPKRILYLLTTLGVPLKIRGPGEGLETEAASVDSELALLPSRTRGRKIQLRGPAPNPLFQQRNAALDPAALGMYPVTRLAAYTFEDVRSMIGRSLAAVDRGKIVLDLSGNDDRMGNDWLRRAARLLPAGRVVLDTSTTVLYEQRDVIGYAAWGSNDKARTRRFVGFRWLPGALVTEYVSTNGRTFAQPPASWTIGDWKDKAAYFAGAPQTLIGDYLSEGATGAAGHTGEPFLHLTPRPDILFPAYLEGRTLAEAYYLAIPALSWQTIIAGDPLCRLRNP